MRPLGPRWTTAPRAAGRGALWPQSRLCPPSPPVSPGLRSRPGVRHVGCGPGLCDSLKTASEVAQARPGRERVRTRAAWQSTLGGGSSGGSEAERTPRVSLPSGRAKAHGPACPRRAGSPDTSRAEPRLSTTTPLSPFCTLGCRYRPGKNGHSGVDIQVQPLHQSRGPRSKGGNSEECRGQLARSPQGRDRSCPGWGLSHLRRLGKGQGGHADGA